MLSVAIIDTGVDFFDEEVFEHNCNKMKLTFGIE